MILARASLPVAVLDHPRVEIEFGTRNGAVFASEQTIKAPPPAPGA